MIVLYNYSVRIGCLRNGCAQGVRTMKMTLRHMEVFRAIMLTGSVSGAARMLFVSQSVVSRMLAHLESRIGFALFERKGGALRPTQNAHVLFKDVTEVFSLAERMDVLIDKMGLPCSDRVAFCASPSLGLSVVPAAVGRFRRLDPNVHFTIKTSLVSEMPSELLGKTADFCLSIWPIEHPNLKCTPLFDGRLMLVVPRGHPLSTRPKVVVRDLQDMPLISFMNGMPVSGLIRESLQRKGLQLDPIVEVTRSEVACALVRREVGVALVYSFSVDENLWGDLVVKEIDIDIPVLTYLITSNFSSLSPHATRFVEILCEEAVALGYARSPSRTAENAAN